MADSTCNGCNKIDDHPKIHVWTNGLDWRKDQQTKIADPSFHGDCIPDEYASLLGHAPQHAVTLSLIQAAKSGVHGDDLRAHIAAQPSDNDVEA